MTPEQVEALRRYADRLEAYQGGTTAHVDDIVMDIRFYAQDAEDEA